MRPKETDVRRFSRPVAMLPLTTAHDRVGIKYTVNLYEHGLSTSIKNKIIENIKKNSADRKSLNVHKLSRGHNRSITTLAARRHAPSAAVPRCPAPFRRHVPVKRPLRPPVARLSYYFLIKTFYFLLFFIPVLCLL